MPIRASYLVQYKKSLIGKQFKALQQLAVFQLGEKLCSPEVFELWKASGVLAALLWYPEIKYMDEYLADPEVAIDNVLDRWAIVEPSRITVRYKLHVLPHIPEAIRRFGPSILFATELFECWNAVFRLCSVLSNHQVPSLDIATTLADMERFKHQVSGGWWKEEDSDEWTQAGPQIRNIKRLSKAKRTSGPWKTILGPHCSEATKEPSSNMNWTDCKYAVARSEDVCFVGSWVFFLDGVKAGVTIVGRIAKILISEGTSSDLETGALAVIEHFSVSNVNDERLDMLLLTRTAEKSTVKPKCRFLDQIKNANNRNSFAR
ncbi:hypothetical protein B0H13DRAFT_1905358 [Mycena leptocephala]|nr:hypothetical protein B0H13DRAFT_1905358 [Mycena leptocephala]